MSCPCEENQCSGKLPAKVIKVIKEAGPILFHRVDRPASLGDDTVTPPGQLDYKNVLLVYEANGHAYLYSSDGIPTFISLSKQDGDISDIEAAIHELQADLANEALARHEADETLQNSITAEAALRASGDAQLQQAVDTLQGGLAEASQEVDNLQDKVVVKDLSVSANSSTVLLNKERGKLSTPDAPGVDMPLPVASETQAGVMNPATFNAVQENAENIDSILGGAVVVDDLTPAPSQTELTESWMTATEKDKLINRASIYDTLNNLVWYYYENVNEWKSMPAGDAAVSVSIATNDTAGIVKGSTEDGQVAVEADGSMSLNGYDGMQHDIENLSQLVAGIEVPKLPTSMVYDFVSPAGANNPSTADNANITVRVVNTGTGAVSNATLMMPMASATQAGSVTAAEKTKLDNLLPINSLGEGFELSEDGVLSATGGGSDVNLLTAYKASPETIDAYSASYMNSRLDNINALHLGGNAIVDSGSIGIAIGANAHAQQAYGIAIGNNASVSHRNGIAIGRAAKTSRRNEASFGFIGDSTQNNPSTRFLANVTAGELPTDAVNLQQMQDYVAENAGNPFTVAQTVRVQNLPLAVVTGFEDTLYNQQDVTLHLDTKDLTSGGIAVQELVLNAAVPAASGTTGSAGIMSVTQANQLHALAEAYEAEERGITLYEGAASVNTIELSQPATNFDHIRVVAEYTGMGSTAIAQSLTVDFYPSDTAKSFQMTATDLTVGDTPMVTTLQDIWMLSDDGVDLDVISSIKAEQGASSLTCTPDTTSQFTILRVVGFGKLV